MNDENMDKLQYVYAWEMGTQRTVNGSIYLDHASAETAAKDAQAKLQQATGFAPAYVVLKRRLTVEYTDWEISENVVDED